MGGSHEVVFIRFPSASALGDTFPADSALESTGSDDAKSGQVNVKRLIPFRAVFKKFVRGSFGITRYYFYGIFARRPAADNFPFAKSFGVP